MHLLCYLRLAIALPQTHNGNGRLVARGNPELGAAIRSEDTAKKLRGASADSNPTRWLTKQECRNDSDRVDRHGTFGFVPPIDPIGVQRMGPMFGPDALSCVHPNPTE